MSSSSEPSIMTLVKPLRIEACRITGLSHSSAACMMAWICSMLSFVAHPLSIIASPEHPLARRRASGPKALDAEQFGKSVPVEV